MTKGLPFYRAAADAETRAALEWALSQAEDADWTRPSDGRQVRHALQALLDGKKGGPGGSEGQGARERDVAPAVGNPPDSSLAERIEALRVELLQVYGDPINELRAIAAELREIAAMMKDRRHCGVVRRGFSTDFDFYEVQFIHSLADRLARKEP